MSVIDYLPVIGDVANALSQSRQNRLNREFAAEQADLAWQRSQQQWERETQYNSFSNQMKLLQDAGLNPNLAYDQSTDSASGQTPQMAEYSGVAPQFNSPMQMAQMRLIDAQIANLNAQSNKTESETEGQKLTNQMTGVQLSEAINEYTAHQQAFLDVIKDGQPYSYDYWSAKSMHELEQVRSELASFGWTVEECKYLSKFARQYGFPPDAALIAKQIERFSKENDLTEQQVKLLDEQITQLSLAAQNAAAFNKTLDSLPKGLGDALRVISVLLGPVFSNSIKP